MCNPIAHAEVGLGMRRRILHRAVTAAAPLHKLLAIEQFILEVIVVNRGTAYDGAIGQEPRNLLAECRQGEQRHVVERPARARSSHSPWADPGVPWTQTSSSSPTTARSAAHRPGTASAPLCAGQRVAPRDRRPARPLLEAILSAGRWAGPADRPSNPRTKRSLPHIPLSGLRFVSASGPVCRAAHRLAGRSRRFAATRSLPRD